MDEDTQIDMRHFDKKSTEFQSVEPGRIIKSPRKFGIEVEMLSKSTQAVAELGESISRAFGFEHDGSIQPGLGEMGIEVVSPIMSGSLGESGVRNLFEKINALKFETNITCGLHTHIDGDGYNNSRATQVMFLSSCTEAILKKIGRKDTVFLVKNKLFDGIKKSADMESKDLAKVLIDEHFTTPTRQVLYLGKTLGVHVPDIRIRPVNVQVGKRMLSLDYYDYTNLLDFSKPKVSISMKELEPSQNDYLCIVKGNNSVSNVKTLLYLYSVFNDIFMAMLPKSRRNNVYAQNLAMSFSPNQIEGIVSYSELETVWYKTRSMMETDGKKGNQYDDSRYYGVNLHSLFAKYGTVEFRSHSATLEPNKVLYWIALNQEILDGIVSGMITIESLRPAVFLSTLEDKLTFFIKVLNLRTSLRKYVKQRIAFFSSNIK